MPSWINLSTRINANIKRPSAGKQFQCARPFYSGKVLWSLDGLLVALAGAHTIHGGYGRHENFAAADASGLCCLHDDVADAVGVIVLDN
tara:strand:- start:192 stop:458 length:267 start_codon:yes stop_codon:yes gene_type:complete